MGWHHHHHHENLYFQGASMKYMLVKADDYYFLLPPKDVEKIESALKSTNKAVVSFFDKENNKTYEFTFNKDLVVTEVRETDKNRGIIKTFSVKEVKFFDNKEELLEYINDLPISNDDKKLLSNNIDEFLVVKAK
uniref:RSVF-multi-epitope designed scaffold n=1 Tax=synthetic construct TaxID=32630 RepID=UPI003D18FD0B